MLKWGDYIIQSNPSHTAPPKMARDFVLKYLEMNPYSYNALLLLGKIYAQSLERDLALKAYLKADSLNPKSGIINYFNLIQLNLNFGFCYIIRKKATQSNNNVGLKMKIRPYQTGDEKSVIQLCLLSFF